MTETLDFRPKYFKCWTRFRNYLKKSYVIKFTNYNYNRFCTTLTVADCWNPFWSSNVHNFSIKRPMPQPLNITINSSVELKVFQIINYHNEQVCEYQLVVISFWCCEMCVFNGIEHFQILSSSNWKICRVD